MTMRSTLIDGIEAIVLPPVRDVDSFTVRRALPSAHRRMVGPFIFFDLLGPAVLRAGDGFDVRPHPHIGLATVTYQMAGEVIHRDNLGAVQAIRPGEVNWMTAGSGIVHSERTPPSVRRDGGSLYGIQAWVALPKALEETRPGFFHHAAAEIPSVDAEGVSLSLIAGTSDGLTSPVATLSDMVYADVSLAADARYRVRAEHVERAIYVLTGAIEVIGQTGSFEAHELVIFKPGEEIVLKTRAGARFMLIGGEPFPEARHVYWNFVSSSLDRIEQAKADWRERRFGSVPGEHEFIPLPADTAPRA